MLTPLDKLLQEAREDASKGDIYVNALLNTQVYVPVWNELKNEIENGEPVDLQPVVANNEDGEFLMAFDTKEKLESWVDVAKGVAEIRGYDLFVMVKDEKVEICLNAGSEFLKVFTRDEIDWILTNVQIEN